MKVVYVYPTLASWGGVERILIDKMNLLAQDMNYKIYILTYNQGEHPIPFQIESCVSHIDLQVRTHVAYRYSGIRKLWEQVKRYRWLYLRLKNQLLEINPDIIVTTTAGELPIICRLKKKIPLVVESHGGYHHLIDYATMSIAHRLDIRYRYYLLKRADVIVSLTNSDANLWRGKYPQVRVIPNIARLLPLTSAPSSLSSKRIIYVGRLAEQKGIPELMAVWRIVHHKHPDWQLEMYGEGDHDYVRQLANGITLHSPVTDIFSCYCASSMLVLTSRWEPFGLVIPEAMSCGLPVVSFEGDGPSSIITDGKDGFLIKNRDVGDFSDRVCQLIENRELRQRMGQTAIQSVQCYASSQIIPMWKDLFESLKK